VTACIVGMLVIAGLHKQPNESPGSEGGSKQYPRHTLDGVPKRPVAEVRRQKPPPANPEPKRDEWRQEKDLQAQLQMAEWAMYAALAAVFGVLVTAVGVWFVKQTLDATRAALGEAEKSSDAAVAMAKAMVGLESPLLRVAWPAITLFHLTPPEVTPERLTGEIKAPRFDRARLHRISLRNYGRTPAFVEAVSFGYAMCTALPTTPKYTQEIRAKPDSAIMPERNDETKISAFQAVTTFTIDATEHDCHSMIGGDTYLWVYFAVQYIDFAKTRREDRFCARWRPRETYRGYERTVEWSFSSDCDPPPAYVERR